MEMESSVFVRWSWAELISIKEEGRLELWGHAGGREGQTNQTSNHSTLYALTSVTLHTSL